MRRSPKAKHGEVQTLAPVCRIWTREQMSSGPEDQHKSLHCKNAAGVTHGGRIISTPGKNLYGDVLQAAGGQCLPTPRLQALHFLLEANT